MRQHHFDLRPKHQATGNLRVVQRFDAKAIAHQGQPILLPFIQGKGKLAPQTRESLIQPQAIGQVHDQLGVAFGSKLIAP
jgi:hypothetical protein